MGLLDDIRKIMGAPAGADGKHGSLALAPTRSVGLSRHTEVMPRSTGRRYVFLVDKSGGMEVNGVVEDFQIVHRSMLDRIAQSDPKATVTYAEYSRKCWVRSRDVAISEATSPELRTSGSADLSHALIVMAGLDTPTARRAFEDRPHEWPAMAGPKRAFGRGDAVIVVSSGNVGEWHDTWAVQWEGKVMETSLAAGVEFWFVVAQPEAPLTFAQSLAHQLHIPVDHARVWPDASKIEALQAADALTLGTAR